MEGRLTFDELAKLEPRLKTLEDDISAIKDDGESESFCANNRWYGYFGHRNMKATLVQLVGWEARGKHGELRTMDAYSTAYEHLYELLPDCRDCGCC